MKTEIQKVSTRSPKVKSNFAIVAATMAFGCLLLITMLFVSPAGKAQSTSAKPVPIHYELQSLRIAESNPIAHVWVLQTIEEGGRPGFLTPYAYNSLTSPRLRQWVSDLPKGSAITADAIFDRYAPVTQKDVIEQIAEEAELEAFRKFCQSKKVIFSEIRS